MRNFFKKKITISLLLITVGYSCHLVYREIKPDLNEKHPYRCGIYQSKIYAEKKDIEKEIYPDLGIMLANAEILQLSNQKKKKIHKMARECNEICILQKAQIRAQEIELKKLLALNKTKNNLDLLSKKLNKIYKMKIEWLKGHRERYEAGVKLLDPEELRSWIYIESQLKPFPKGTK